MLRCDIKLETNRYRKVRYGPSSKPVSSAQSGSWKFVQGFCWSLRLVQCPASLLVKISNIQESATSKGSHLWKYCWALGWGKAATSALGYHWDSQKTQRSWAWGTGPGTRAPAKGLWLPEGGGKEMLAPLTTEPWLLRHCQERTWGDCLSAPRMAPGRAKPQSPPPPSPLRPPGPHRSHPAVKTKRPASVSQKRRGSLSRFRSKHSVRCPGCDTALRGSRTRTRSDGEVVKLPSAKGPVATATPAGCIAAWLSSYQAFWARQPSWSDNCQGQAKCAGSISAHLIPRRQIKCIIDPYNPCIISSEMFSMSGLGRHEAHKQAITDTALPLQGISSKLEMAF